MLQKQGPSTRHAGMFSFTANAQVVEQEHIIRAYLAEAMEYAAAGLTQPKPVYDLELPAELADALSNDFAYAEAFNALTPGRQRSYIFNVNSAKKSQTRIARIAKFRHKVIAGKGAQERSGAE